MDDDSDSKSINVLEQIGEDPWVQGRWKFSVAWFVIRLIAVIVMFLVVVFSN